MYILPSIYTLLVYKKLGHSAYFFIRFESISNALWGFTPAAVAAPTCDNARKGNTKLSQSAGEIPRPVALFAILQPPGNSPQHRHCIRPRLDPAPDSFIRERSEGHLVPTEVHEVDLAIGIVAPEGGRVPLVVEVPDRCSPKCDGNRVVGNDLAGS